MDVHAQPIRALLDRVRNRWRRAILFRAIVRAGLAVAAVLAAALAVSPWIGPMPVAFAVLGLATLLLATSASVWALWPARHVPSDARVARFIEEQEPSLDDRLASAVDLLSGDRPQAVTLAGPMVADAGRRAEAVDPVRIVPSATLRRAGFQAAAAATLALAVAYAGRETARQSLDAASLVLFPSRVVLEITPGHARVPTGSPLAITARLVGTRAPVTAELLREATPNSEDWRAVAMTSESPGEFRARVDEVVSPFRYRVVAGTLRSETYDVTVARPPRVQRIDVEYRYPGTTGQPPHIEEDGGDIYAPAGTRVRVRVRVDQPTTAGAMVMAGGPTVTLTAQTAAAGELLDGTLTVAGDGSYRVSLTSADGLTNPGDTEYFIRAVEDRPPTVRVVRPARDRSVTPLEEVDIEAEAEDDVGVGRLELVYTVRGGAEKVVPMVVPPRATSVTGAGTLYLEDLDLEPGDFIAYYVRARDLPRGKRPSETRSDIFFLEVRPFEQEFTLAQSQAMGGGGSNRSVDDLVTAQKEIIVATWKLDRRGQAADAKSKDDIVAVAKAEAELKTRVEETSSSFRASTLRDPRRRPSQGRGGALPGPRAGQTSPEEDAMTAASLAMGRAVSSLEKLRTADALTPEMEALDHLLKAQADVRERQVSRQQAGSGAGANRATQDMSSLFDRELQRQQQTNYETPTTTEQRQDATASALDRIKELARRQDELNARQQALARADMSAEDRKRELERLTREQSELRQRAEELAREMSRQSPASGQQSQNAQSSPSRGSQQAGQSGRGQGQPSRRSEQGQSADRTSQQLRAASEEMRSAATGMQRQNPEEAATRGQRALARLRDLERSLQRNAPDEQRRALGDAQLEAREIADAERQVGRELDRARDVDALRRLAAEQERLSERVRRLEDGLERQSAGGAVGQRADPAAAASRASGRGGDARRDDLRGAERAAAEAAREIERQRLAERMEEAAEGIRSAAQRAGSKASRSDRDDIARALDRIADRLASASAPAGDDEARRLADQLARSQELGERIESLTQELEQLDVQARRAGQAGRGADTDGHARGQASAGAESTASGRAGRGATATGGDDQEFAELRREYARQLEQARELLDQLRRDDPEYARGGLGVTFEGQGMVLSAPGTEAFKQDFARWVELTRQATQALDGAASVLAARLSARQTRDRLAAGADDKAPAAYEQQVDSYFKALATRK